MLLLIFQLCIFLFSFSKGSKEFLTFLNESQRSSEVCCNDDNILSCTKVKLDPAKLSSKKITLKGIQLQFSNEVEPNGYDYKNSQGDEAVLSFNKETGNMFGSLKTHDGRSFAIEKCHHGHVWKEFNISSFKDDIDVETEDRKAILSSREIPTDRQTIVTYSVMFYYTAEFAAATADIEGYIDQVIDETNEGYINSKIPIRVAKFCSERATLNDQDVWEANLGPFSRMKSSISALTNTADAAALLVQNNKWCGYANFFNRRYALQVVQKSCALGYYTFGHELGHNFGADHDPRVVPRPRVSYGRGHLILPSGSRYRTVMAYGTDGHWTRVNYWSNPDVIFPATNTPTGVRGISNNARVLTENRFTLAAYGDESGSCGCKSFTQTGEWKPIIDCRENLKLALTPQMPGQRDTRWKTAPFSSRNRYQLWKHTPEGYLINQGYNKALYWSNSGSWLDFKLANVDSLKRMRGVTYKWSFNKCTRSSQEPSGSISDKMEAVGSGFCVNIANRYYTSGYTVMKYPCKTIHPVNACFKFKNF